MLGGEIATQSMATKDVETLHLLLRQWDRDFPNTGDVTTACIWADLLKCNSVVTTYCPSSLTPSWSLYNAWHYVNLPVALPPSRLPNPVDPAALLASSLDGSANHVLTGIFETLRTTHSPWTANHALRLFLHVFGDVHNPLHAAAGVSARFPRDDAGGNSFVFRKPCVTTNLHAMWDSLAGVYGSVNWSPDMTTDSADRRAINHSVAAAICRLGGSVESQQVKACVDGSAYLTQLFVESHDVAARDAYTGLNLTCDIASSVRTCQVACPSDAYQHQVVGTAEAQLVRGGTRLAVILTQFARQLRQLKLLETTMAGHNLTKK
ncbi:hypothetical protein H257_15520 [Aphanomyces astaci]|uniref:Uncharacterized protein n=1 Tax=Aphanomyces astaci TaxID=112090 RepID=W4FNL0_APHAT|nr:hypothetical protein H257_15520 [Aphanomyces astaci]ETV68531.1 hypothetical protein H257_15520 [Aphanomyces astaci]|eukprot:XP_009841960.1 hypothetical protein H257_15520 [Aphanomyces astaci]